MRLKISLEVNDLVIPFSYKHILQALVYNMLDTQEEGSFYHNDGYNLKDKKYKMFVLSDLFGKYRIENKKMVFESIIEFYIDSLDEAFIQYIYEYLLNNEYLYICKQQAKIKTIDLFNTPVFKGEKELIIQTLSPVVAYTSKDKYFTYFKPSEDKFMELVRDNIMHKCIAYQYPIKDILFEVKEVFYEKEKIIYFKNTFYKAYQCKLKIQTNYETFKILYETGLSAKGSCGFGMVKVINN